MVRTLALLIAACLLHAEALAQPATRRVFVDASTASGASVVDLRADEFEITEGGERRDVASAKLGRRPAMHRVIDDLFHRFAQTTDTDLLVSLMIGRATGGAYTNISPNGLLEVLERLATVINEAHASALSYQMEYASAPVKGKKPGGPQVPVLREGVTLNVISTP